MSEPDFPGVSEIRRRFLDYFASNGHEIVASSPLVPGNDNTLLFTNAGMVQFKDCFLGTEKRGYQRATTSQRCVRAGGKHNDLENVGYTARHHTFFEMLGNFSFGDYFKRNAIDFAWGFLTAELGLPADKLWITVFEEDDEAYEIWEKRIGVPRERIARIGAKDNFWQMGDTGPCGPCSEIFFDHGPDVWGGPPGTPDEDGDRYIEIWNLVFMQFDRAADGTMTPLPQPSVDTGMGLERIAAVLQGVHSNYEIDLFVELLAAVQKVTGAKDVKDPSLRVIADHIRSCAFLIVDGVLPSNEGRGYVLRRIIRRAVRHGHKLGAEGAFFDKLVAPLVALMGEAYPELVAAEKSVVIALRDEEARFAETLTQGMKILEDDIAVLKGKTIPGATVFKLYDTFGFPVDLTADIARERELQIDESGFEAEMQAQRERARAASQFGGAGIVISTQIETEFTGYESLQESAKVMEIFIDGNSVNNTEGSLSAGGQLTVVLDKTPFYAESGGQVGDRGQLSSSVALIEVVDTQKSGSAHLHIAELKSGAVSVGDFMHAQVDLQRRTATLSNHSGTHLLHAALRHYLGEHVAQKGSLVTPDHLRFDFSHGQSVDADELQKIELWVNQQIRVNRETVIAEMTKDAALEKGAMALFGEKYGDVVRVVDMGPDSIELCGGTHVARAGDIGTFRIVAETGVAAGVRRIEAITGATAIRYSVDQQSSLTQIASTLNVPLGKAADRVAQLNEQGRALQKEIDRLKAKLASQTGDQLLDQAMDINGVKVLAVQLENADTKTLRESMDKLKDKLGTAAIVLAAVEDDKVRVIAGITRDVTDRVKAGDLVNVVAEKVGGKGGGRPDLAQAGGNDPSQLAGALEAVPAWLKGKL